MADVFTLTLASDHTTPVRAYASLRSHAPDHSSFLLESVVKGAPWGRYSIVGYRGEGETMYPPGDEGYGQLLETMVRGESPEGLAERFSRGSVGFLTYEASQKQYGVKPWEQQATLARVMRGATVAVFDHLRHTVTIAGPGRGNVKRAAWEMTHGYELAELVAPDPSLAPEWIDLLLADDVFTERARRAERRITAGEAGEVVLGRSFFTPLRNAEPLDVYRALRVLSPSPYLFFLEYAETPFAPGMVVTGASPGSLVRLENNVVIAAGQERAAEGSPGEIFRASFPSATVVGSPPAKAAAIARDLEATCRGLFGGAVGYVLPDGTIDMAVATGTVVIQDGTADITTAATIRAGSDAAEATAETRRLAAPALAAVRAAQIVYEQREAAEEARKVKLAAKEQAEREKAEKDREEGSAS